MSKLRVYIAGSSKEHARASAMADHLTAIGVEVVDRWWEGAEQWAGKDADRTDEEQRQIAGGHMQAIRCANLLWLLAPEVPSAGAASELMFAHTIYRPILVTGEHARSSVYYSLADWRDLTDAEGLDRIAAEVT